MAVRPSPVPRLRSSMMAGAVSAPAIPTRCRAGFNGVRARGANPEHLTKSRLIDHHARPHGRGQRDALQILALGGGGLRLLQVRNQRMKIFLQRVQLESRLADGAVNDAGLVRSEERRVGKE